MSNRGPYSDFFLSVLFKRISFCKPPSFVRHKARYNGSGWSFGRPIP